MPDTGCFSELSDKKQGWRNLYFFFPPFTHHKPFEVLELFSTDNAFYFPPFPSQPRDNKSNLAGWFRHIQGRGLCCRVHPAASSAGGVPPAGSRSQGLKEMHLLPGSTFPHQQRRGIYWETSSWEPLSQQAFASRSLPPLSFPS